jgi:hypothetical protein
MVDLIFFFCYTLIILIDFLEKVLFRIVDKHAEITPLPEDSIKAMRGILKGGCSLAKELLAERERDNKIDEKHTPPILEFGI